MEIMTAVQGEIGNKSNVNFHSFAYIFGVHCLAVTHFSGLLPIRSMQSRMTSVCGVMSSNDLPYDFCVRECVN
jgi:hypothetical protein